VTQNYITTGNVTPLCTQVHYSVLLTITPKNQSLT